jgi:Heterokaryon incompatibility protein (HET)
MSLFSIRRFGVHGQGRPQKHKYTRLESPSTQIRLLQLLNPSESQLNNRNSSFRVQCVTKTVSFREIPLFIALSYAWGKSSDKSPILLDGQIAMITKNLEDALIHYQNDRSVSDTFHFWIDAVGTKLCLTL